MARELRLVGRHAVSQIASEVPAERLPEALVREIRRTRRHPRPTQFDYLHLRCLLRDLSAALGGVRGSPEVLDIFCGTRPYEDLLPPRSRCVGLDIDETYGCADVVSKEFLPFPDSSFDLVMCTHAFYYVTDPVRGVAEIGRVLRPGGMVVISVPLVWEYDRTILEHRYTGPELAALFVGWRDAQVVENGGFAVSWAFLTGLIINRVEERVPKRLGIRLLLRPCFAASYLAVNLFGTMLDAAERRLLRGPWTLPMNLLLTARAPNDE